VIAVQIGDAHLQPGAGRQAADRRAALESIAVWCEQMRRGELGLIAWPGDLWDGRSDIAERNWLTDYVTRLCDLAPLVILPGNHDLPGELEVLARLRTRFPVYLFRRPEVQLVRDALGCLVAVGGFPYPHKAGLVARGEAKGDVSAAALPALEVVMASLGAQFAAAAAQPDFAGGFLFGHFNVAGSLASSGQPQIGREIDVPLALLEQLPAWVQVGLNHIHKHQALSPRVVYAGSVCRMNFGEIEPKGFLEFAYGPEAGFVDDHWGARWAFQDLRVPLLLTVAGELTPDGFTVTDWRGASLEAAAGADVRVQYVYDRANAAAIDEAHIHALFAQARSVKPEGRPKSEASVRAPEVQSATRLEDKVRAWVELEGGVWSPELEADLAALLSQPAEVLLQELGASDAN
jgi:hypothetical protein